MRDTLPLPYFARRDEYFQAWMIDPVGAKHFWQLALSMDMAAHFKQAGGIVDTPLSFIDAGKAGKKIAVVQALGLLMKGQSSMGGTSTVAMRRAIRTASADPNVTGILLDVDSPGGTVAGTQQLADEVYAANQKKPVFAHVSDTGASAAYWVASQAAMIFADTPNTMVGSIGTVLHMEDTSAKNEKEGVREIAFASGPLKAFGGGLGINDAQANHLQSMVNSMQEQFAAGVRRGRGLTDSRLSEVATGAVFPALEAKKLGLINGVQSRERTISLLASA